MRIFVFGGGGPGRVGEPLVHSVRGDADRDSDRGDRTPLVRIADFLVRDVLPVLCICGTFVALISR